ncbi:MAG: hypothetical protein IJO96_06150 [Oscillospiraceae bacterium]|nr:hypothetical protein [Oscillospiraceae bacterium]
MPARIEEIDKLRKKRSRKVFFKRLVIFLLVVFLMFSLFVGMRYASDYDIGGFVTDFISGVGRGPGFPIAFAGNTVSDIYPANGNVALLTDTGFYLYKSDAKELLHTYFDYGNPTVISSKNRFLIYDCFGYSYRIETPSNTMLENTYDDKIIGADYSRSGHTAILTESPRSLATVKVFDKNNNELFSWSSTENYLTACSLSSDGKHLAVSGLMTSGGRLRSVIISFNVTNGEELFRRYYEDTIIYDIAAVSKNRVYAVMENNAVVVSSNGSAEMTFDYSNRTLSGYRRTNNELMALIFTDDDTNKNSITLLDSDCFELFTLTDVTEITDIYVSTDGLYLLSDSTVSFYNTDGVMTKTASAEEDILAFTVMDSLAYAVTDSSILTLTFEPVITE